MYRNIYRFLINKYIIIIELTWRERKRRINILSLILNLYIKDFINIIKILKLNSIILNRGVKINNNRIKTFVYIYIITFIENMK